MPTSPFSRGRTARDVEQEYSRRIEGLMSEFEHRLIPRLSRRNFGDLAEWARSTYTAKSELESENQRLKRSLDEANDQSAALRNKLEEEIRERQKLQAELSETRNRFDTEILQLKNEHQNEMDVTAKSWESYTRELQQGHQTEKNGLDRKINHLLSDIMVAQADSRAWSDEKLKTRFGELKRLVEKVTSPHFVGEVRDVGALHRLDSSGFLSRVNDRPHFLLRNALWNILCAYFFSSPWGFGAFGPGAGKDGLVYMYEAWRSIFGGADISENAISAVFSGDGVANQWRSVTFESIVAGLRTGNDTSLHSALKHLYESNIASCEEEVGNLLLRITGKYPNQQTVKELTRSAAELGLQFGVQPSHMRLDQPAHQQVVEIGDGFVDCVNGEISKGKRVKVDIFSSPGLTRVGDGKKDFQLEISLVPGQVYPFTS